MLSSLLLLLLMTMTAIVAPLAAADKDRCLVNVPEVNPKRYLYHQGRTMDLRLDASERVTHQLATHVFAIYLREVLGYAFTVVVTDQKHQNDSEAFHRLDDDTTPTVMANVEVWISPELDLAYFADMPSVKDCGVIAPPGRVGWFIPSRLSKLAPGMDTWQFFTRPDQVGVFDVADEDLDLIKEHAQTVCGDPECEEGLFVPEKCKPLRHKTQPCALLLAGDYDEDRYVMEHVRSLSLYVKVAWLGDSLRNVTQALLRRQDGRGRSLVVLSRSPGDATLVDGDAFVSVRFPACDFFNAPSPGCSYARRRLAKLAWAQLEVAGRPAWEALQKLALATEDYQQLLTFFHASRGSVETAACHWLRRNEAKWALWKPSHEDNYLLHIGGIFPMSGVGSTSTARGIVRASELALEAINSNTSVLRDYKLKLLANNGQCAADIVMKTFIEYVLNGRYRTLAGILGPACSDTVEPLAGVTKHFKTVVISYSAEGASFSDRNKYPYFFRTIGENKQYKHVYLKLFEALQWKRVAALTEDGQKYSEYISHLQDLLHLHDITLTNRKFPREREKDAMAQYLREMKSKHVRVIIVDVYDHVARDIMCEAYRLEMTARQGYVWFLPLWLNQDWYDPKDKDFPCTKDHMKDAINGHLSLSHAYFGRDSECMQEGVTVGEWRRKYEERCRNTSVEMSNYAGYAYDAVWTYALALDRLARENQSYLYELHSEATTRRLVQLISSTDFAGVSGRIQFLGGGPSRVTVVNVVQWLNGTTRNVGYFEPNVSTEKVDIVGGRLVLNESLIVWLSPDGQKPGDGLEPVAPCYVEALSRLLGVSCQAAIVIVPVTGFSFLGLLLIVAFIVVKRRYDKKVQLTQKYMKSLGIDLLSASNMGNLDKWEIPRDKVVINRKLGEGAFGTVYGGEAHFPDSGWVAVAVKTLKVGSTTEEKLDFLSEAEVMKRFEHKNVVKLLGVCTKNEPVYTVMEFMLYGDLKTFLLARRHLVNDRMSEESDEISSKKLTQMALDIARALSYLADLKFVHRDVASRNCLVNVARVVKLGDFGMTRPMFENDYYRFNRKGMLPVRWMAPESLELGIFTPSSDVWSFGVLLYEIITFGSFPFQGLSNNQVLEHVKAGNTLQIPSGVKPQLEGLIRSCWNQDYKRRPQASEIVEFLANNPRLLAPCLDVPLSSVQIEDTGQLEMTLPERFRKCSMPAAQFLHPDAVGGSSSGAREPLLGPKYVTLHHCDEGCEHDAMSSL